MRRNFILLCTVSICFIFVFSTPVYESPLKGEGIWEPSAVFRISIAALELAGYIEVGNDIYEAEQSFFSKTTKCLPLENRVEEGLSIRSLTLAISAIEQYNRSSFFREIEFMIARLMLLMTGEIPNFSYGIAQIQANVAKSILEKRSNARGIEEGVLIDILQDDCESLLLAADHITSILSESKNVSLHEQIRLVSINYNGVIEPMSSVSFRKALVAAYNILGPDYLWNYMEYDLSDREPLVIYGDPDELPSEDSLFLSYASLSEGISMTSQRNIVYIVSLTNIPEAANWGKAKELGKIIREKLLKNGVKQEIRMAVKVISSFEDKSRLVEIYVGNNPGMVYFFE